MTTTTTDVVGFRARGSDQQSGLHIVLVDGHAVDVVAVDKAEVCIGRSRSCEVVLRDQSASRRHAMLLVKDSGRIEIEDLTSSNGTLLDGVRLGHGDRRPLSPTAVVEIGGTRLIVQNGMFFPGRRKLSGYDELERHLVSACEGARSVEPLALIRWEASRSVGWARAVAALTSVIPPPHLFYPYGDRHYLGLCLGVGREEASQLASAGEHALAAGGGVVRSGVAIYPRDGVTADALLESARNHGQPLADGPSPVNDVLGPEMQRVLKVAERAAQSSISILLRGETGVGKDVLARKIHELSPRRNRLMLSLNSAGLSEALIDSELFGHERGAFTGATAAKKGLLETADGGTVFFDEIGDIPASIQLKLLRVLETREIQPLGALKPRVVDVRFISATNRDLEADRERGHFRDDLFFRLAGLEIKIPPLRERREEILSLARTFIAATSRAMNRPEPRLTPAAEDELLRHEWRGNIRELRNTIERAVLLCERDQIDAIPFPSRRLPAADKVVTPTEETTTRIFAERMTPRQPTDERTRIVNALAKYGGNQTKAARALGISRGTLILRIKKYGIPRPQIDATSSEQPAAERDDG